MTNTTFKYSLCLATNGRGGGLTTSCWVFVFSFFGILKENLTQELSFLEFKRGGGVHEFIFNYKPSFMSSTSPSMLQIINKNTPSDCWRSVCVGHGGLVH